ncbi:unnamed protein product, partial [Rotaria magnacalcarata]
MSDDWPPNGHSVVDR